MGPELINQRVREYFRLLGYEVDWDKRAGKLWHEVLSQEGTLLVQIDYGIPITAIHEDISCLADGLPGTSAYNYQINAPKTPEVQKLLLAVKAHPPVASHENYSL